MSFYLIRTGAGAVVEKFLTTKYRTYDALETALLAETAGTLARLWGPTDPIATFVSVAGPGVGVACVDVDFSAADGTEFTMGTTNAFNIQRVGTANALTWATPGASGGLIMDGSGGYAFHFLGPFAANGAIKVAANVHPTVTTPVDGQEYAAGWRSDGQAKITGGGIERISGSWYRRGFYNVDTAPITSGSISIQWQEKSGPRDALVYASGLSSDSVNPNHHILAGLYSGDQTPSSASQYQTMGGVYLLEQADNTPWLWANANGGSLSVRVSNLTIAGATP